MSANPKNLQTSQPPELIDQLRGKTRLLHYSKRTEDAYADWATKFILFHGRVWLPDAYAENSAISPFIPIRDDFLGDVAGNAR